MQEFSRCPCLFIYILFDFCWYLTNISGAVWMQEKITLLSLYILGRHMYVLSTNESLSRGHLEISSQLAIHSDIQVRVFTPDNFYKPVLFLFHSFFIPLSPPLFLPVSSIMHVFTSKVIVPDLYDRPLTLRVLVHQHQAEKHPRACVSRTKSGSLSFSGCNLQLEHTPTNHIYSCTVRRCESVTEGEECWGWCAPKKYTFSLSVNSLIELFIFEQIIFICGCVDHGNRKLCTYNDWQFDQS